MNSPIPRAYEKENLVLLFLLQQEVLLERERREKRVL